MKRLAALTLTLALSALWTLPVTAQRLNMADSGRLSRKTAKQQQKMYKKAAKNQQKAMKNYNKTQQKAAKKANHNAKRRA